MAVVRLSKKHTDDNEKLQKMFPDENDTINTLIAQFEGAPLFTDI